MADEDRKREKGTKSLLQYFTENGRWRSLLAAAGLIGIFLIFLSGYLPQKEEEVQNVQEEMTVSETEKYARELEKSLADIVSRISGAGETKVLVTMEKGSQTVYAREEKKTTQSTGGSETGLGRSEENESTETKYILIKGADGSQQALAVMEVEPVVKGVIIVCQGGSNPVVQQNIINAVTTALDISSARVCVVQGQVSGK